MPVTISQTEPPALTAGETLLFQRDLSPDYPAPTWALNYVLLGPARITINGAANGVLHEITANAVTTANYTPGRYSVTARVSDGTNVFPVAPLFPVIEIRADPASDVVPALSDPRTWAEQTLELVETALKALASKTVSQTTVNGTTYTLIDLDKLRGLRAEILQQVRSEKESARVAAGLPSSRIIGIRFTRPG